MSRLPADIPQGKNNCNPIMASDASGAPVSGARPPVAGSNRSQSDQNRCADWENRSNHRQRPVGSGWDVSGFSDRIKAHHLAEWVDGSAVHPELAAANLQSLQGTEVLEAIAGHRLEQLGGWAQQHATSNVVRLTRPLEPVAEGGVWWCAGLDPLADWGRPMDWGCAKPDRPRLEHREGKGPKALKYEHPIGVPTRSIWLRVPAVVAQRVADRFGLELPLSVALDVTGDAGAFWRWWAQEPLLPLVIEEGAKKAGALLSIGIPAVALPGIDNGAKRTGPKGTDGRRTGPRELLADLAGVPLKGRPVWVLFDHSDSREGRRAVRMACRRLGHLLAKAGANVLVGAVPAGPHKGADDWLAAGRSWEDLAKALKPLEPLPVLPRLRAADVVAPAGQYLGQAAPIPDPKDALLVALQTPMGGGKTEAIRAGVSRAQAQNLRVLVIAHRRALGEQGAEVMGLPWAEEAKPGSDLRQQGLALCIDSLCPGSGLQIRPADWRRCVVVIDEVVAVLRHALFGTGTAIADRRVAVLDTLAEILRNAAQVIVADAQLSDEVLGTLETITGHRAYLIGSDHQPAAGRRLIQHATAGSWRAQLVEHLEQRRRLWIATTAREGTNGAATIAALVGEHWPEARVLVVDSDTVNSPGHPAHRLAADPNGIAADYDVVVCSPAVAAGLSVDQLPGHFDAVMVHAGGCSDPDAVAQAAARVRDGCPRHLYAPARSPGGKLQVGSGDLDPRALVRHLRDHQAALLGELVGACNWDPAANSAGAWLPLWALLAAHQNRQRLAYAATVAGLLEREGYRPEAAASTGDGAAVTARLQELGQADCERRDAAVIAADPITDQQAAELNRKRRRTPAEEAELERWLISRAWALGDGSPTPEILEAHREGMANRLRFGWLMQNPEARAAVIEADRATAQQQTAAGSAWAPDQCRELQGPDLNAAVSLGLPSWLARGEWFGADDAQLLALHALATGHGAALRQVLGISPGKRATTTLRGLLALAGYQLEPKRARAGEGKGKAAGYRYRVAPLPLPDGVDLGRMQAAWTETIDRGGVPKTPIQEKGEGGFRYTPTSSRGEGVTT